MYTKQCPVCKGTISHKFKSQLAKQRTCSHRCQMLGNKNNKGNNGISSRYKIGHLPHNWKGDEVGYFALHAWVRRKRGTPSKCEHCGTMTAKRFEWANISREYLRDLEDWVRLCKSCHILYDKT